MHLSSPLTHRVSLLRVLAAIYTMVGDMDISVDGASSTHQASSSRGRKSKQKRFALPEGAIKLPTRSCPATPAQLYVLASGISVLLNPLTTGPKGGLLKEKDATPEQVHKQLMNTCT